MDVGCLCATCGSPISGDPRLGKRKRSKTRGRVRTEIKCGMGKSLANSFGRSKVRKTLQTLGLQTGGFDKKLIIPAFPGAEGGGMYTPAVVEAK